jgi:uncharacterized protein (TIGR04222 family)
MKSIATTWGITETQFLWFYAGLCAVVAAAIARQWHRALGARTHSKDPTPNLGIYKVAMLNGGAQLAISTALTKLYRDGVVRAGVQSGTHVVDGELPADADRLERAVFETVRHDQGISTEALRAELAESEPIRWLSTELTEVGLLVEEGTARRLRWLWLWAALVALLGAARVVADSSSGYLILLVAGVISVTVWLARQPTHATARGREIVRAERETHDELRRVPQAGESVMAVALFGGAALWMADPAIASAIDVPREDSAGWRRSSYTGGGCSAGGGGCAGAVGGGCGGGGGSCGGGGGCGGGGCGGGGG